MNSETLPDSTEAPNAEIAPESPPITSRAIEDDDFADEELGERQADACSMDEGCTVCQ